MNITTKGRYALRVMLDLAQHPDDGFVSLKTAAERQDISLKYLEMIISHLKKANLVESTRGKEGGYRLTRAPEGYSVLEILNSIEDNTIVHIAGKPETKKHLEDLGFHVGGTVRIVSELGGNVIVDVKNTKIALDRTLASKIGI